MSSHTRLTHLAYVSTETRKLSSADLIDLLQKARAANEHSGITGLLLYKADSFFQIIEGSEAAIKDTFQRITEDPRHEGIDVLFEEGIDNREYSEWSMGFVNLDAVDPSMLKGYSHFLESNENPRSFLRSLGRGERLARIFKALA